MIMMIINIMRKISPPLLCKPRPPRLFPLALLRVVELDAVQSLPTVPASDHCNKKVNGDLKVS